MQNENLLKWQNNREICLYYDFMMVGLFGGAKFIIYMLYLQA